MDHSAHQGGGSSQCRDDKKPDRSQEQGHPYQVVRQADAKREGHHDKVPDSRERGNYPNKNKYQSAPRGGNGTGGYPPRKSNFGGDKAAPKKSHPPEGEEPSDNEVAEEEDPEGSSENPDEYVLEPYESYREEDDDSNIVYIRAMNTRSDVPDLNEPMSVVKDNNVPLLEDVDNSSHRGGTAGQEALPIGYRAHLHQARDAEDTTYEVAVTEKIDHERMIYMNAWDTYEASSIGPESEEYRALLTRLSRANNRLQTASCMADELANMAVETAREILHLHYQGEGSKAESEEDSTPSPGLEWVLASDEADTSTNEVEQLLGPQHSPKPVKKEGTLPQPRLTSTPAEWKDWIEFYLKEFNGVSFTASATSGLVAGGFTANNPLADMDHEMATVVPNNERQLIIGLPHDSPPPGKGAVSPDYGEGDVPVNMSVDAANVPGDPTGHPMFLLTRPALVSALSSTLP
ncbi:hypothetical protein BV22DRAFT_1135034 [Leucogyrophana mollusca]|uniref:Uncharacterized protein n=1 Tax=Leucogyrophana mollusca TaxID=85980 RepID=A0ACB8AY34_9AGAM|nr:hypothetical protein BV22DRAFT_1135034 [Leucogyrophana mollusca]